MIEGDTIEIDGQRIRILDIDAPELNQSCIGADGSEWPCGRSAALALSEWIGSRSVDCAIEDQDPPRSRWARCTLDGSDVAKWLAWNGHAVPYKDCTCTFIRKAAERAKMKKIGIWAGSFQAPWEWHKAE